MNITTRIHNVIKIASPELIELKDDYFIIGTSALVLSGIEVETSDIDILASDRDADYLKDVWKDKLLKNIKTKDNELFQSNFSRYNYELLDIEIMGNLQVRKDDVWSPVVIKNYNEVDIEGVKIKIPTINELKRILLLFGREKDISKIKLIEKMKF